MQESVDKGNFGITRLAITLDMLPLREQNLILDVGSGDGTFAWMLKKRFDKVNITCLDFSSVRIKQAKNMYGNEFFYIVADAAYLPIKSGVADSCAFLEVVEHLDGRRGPKAIGELSRVLKKGGYLLLSTPNRASFTSFTGSIVYKVFLGKKWVAWDKTHVKLYTPHEIENLLESLNFEIIKNKGYWFFPSGLSYFLDPMLRKHGWYRKISSYALEIRIGVHLGFIIMYLAKKG